MLFFKGSFNKCEKRADVMCKGETYVTDSCTDISSDNENDSDSDPENDPKVNNPTTSSKATNNVLNGKFPIFSLMPIKRQHFYFILNLFH